MCTVCVLCVYCVRACVRACVHVCVRVYVCMCLVHKYNVCVLGYATQVAIPLVLSGLTVLAARQAQESQALIDALSTA